MIAAAADAGAKTTKTKVTAPPPKTRRARVEMREALDVWARARRRKA
jgi:hypothetical protein